jgi:hypothetical protein
MKSPVRSLVAALLIATHSLPVLAIDAPAPAAAPASDSAELKAKGDALFRARNYTEAIAAYEQAYAATHDARVLYNQARALQALGRHGEALLALNRFVSEAPPDLKAQLTGLDGLQADLRSRVTEVTVSANEPGAQVIFRDQVIGVTPLTGPLLLEAGAGKLRVVKDGFFPYVRDLTLRGGGTATFDVTLGSTERHARLLVKSRVQGALVSIDGRKLAQAPAEALLLPGTHQVLARRDGFADASTQVIVDAGQNRTIELNPVEQHPLLKQWWFWAGVGVVVAAGTTTAIVIARQHRADSDGNFSPSAVGAPLIDF